ncbi:MAG: hypothetical protein JSW28_09565, partial [Thermoplasmata archaeon]
MMVTICGGGLLKSRKLDETLLILYFYNKIYKKLSHIGLYEKGGDYMVFWKGKIELNLPKYTYSPGENITGEITLKLKKSIKARGLNVCLNGV